MLFKNYTLIYEAIERSKPVHHSSPAQQYEWMLNALKKHAARRRMQDVQKKGQPDAKDVCECAHGGHAHSHEES